MSNEAFARKLGIAVRTVANWRAQLDLVPMPEMQQLLDATLSAATADEKTRFFAQHTAPPVRQGALADTAAEPVRTLTVAVAIVADRSGY
jgi:hypothetical protein